MICLPQAAITLNINRMSREEPSCVTVVVVDEVESWLSSGNSSTTAPPLVDKYKENFFKSANCGEYQFEEIN